MKPKYFLILILFFSLLSTQYSLPTIRFVSKTGTSTPPYTSWNDAADSIQKCINICSFGDTVYVANGVYKENLVINTAISLIGSCMDSTVIDGTGLGDFTITVNSNFKVSNFNIYGKGKGVPGSRVVWAAIQLTFVEIQNCIISEAERGVSSVNSNLTANNLLMENLDGGFSLVSGNSSNWIISNCVIFLDENNSNGISIGFAQYAESYINNNIIIFNRQLSNYTGDGISLGLPKKVYISNNLISGFTDNIYVDDVIDTVFIKNNALLYQNTLSSNPASIFGSGDIIEVKNVILSKNKKAIYGGLIKSNYNIFWGNLINLEGLPYGDSDRVADPMFVNDTLPSATEGYDFHLQKYSSAIDKGDPNILDVDGSRSDIGLFGGPLGQKYTYQDLAPKPPANLTAIMDSGLVHLKWNKNTEADFYRYRVYRDTVPDFIYDTTKIIAVIADSLYYDDPPQKFISGNYYYKVTAIDNEYHQSAASEEVHINITGIPEAPPIVVEHYKLLQNYPNPFNPSTTIPYRLKAPGYVKVMVYNILGEMVKVLVNKYQNAGYYEVLFNPTASERKRGEEGFPGMETWYHSNYVSGVYLLRIEVIGEGNIPVFTDMRKMLLIK